MDQLTLDQSANKFAQFGPSDARNARSAFKAGAKWQNDQYAELRSLAFFASEKLKGTAADGLAKMISEQLEKLKDGK